MIISVYGYGKYKTESAVGCAIRAIQNNHKVLFVQFLKNGTSSEIAFFKKQDNIKVMVGEVDKITLPKNITLATQPVVNVSVQKDNESIAHLKESNALMTAMLNHMINTAGNSGNTTVVATQVSSDQVLQILQQNPAALQNILGKNKSTGWR